MKEGYIKRATSTIPFGYELVDESSSFLKPIDEELEALFGLKPHLDKFFDEVFVNHENVNIKTNRKNLIGLVYQAFKNIADIQEITI